jgi:tape measure domain-containing protein
LANAQSRVKAWSRKISGLTKAAFGVAFIGLGASIGAIIKKSAQLAAQFEQIKVAFTTMTGSADKAKGLIDSLIEFAKNTPFTPEKVQSAAKKLLAFGFASEVVESKLRVLGDVSAGTGKDLAELAVIYGQIKAAGRLMGQDLLQLINAGFNPLNIIAKKTGKSMLELRKDMEKGLISFDQVEDAFRTATGEGGLFFNMMENQSKTLSGTLTILEGSVSDLMRQFGELTLPELKLIVLGGQEAVNLLQDLADARKLIEASGESVARGAGGGSATGMSPGQAFAAEMLKQISGAVAQGNIFVGADMADAAGRDAAESFLEAFKGFFLEEGVGLNDVGFTAPIGAGLKEKREAKRAEEEKAAEEAKIAADLKAAQIEQKEKADVEDFMADLEADIFFDDKKLKQQQDAAIADDRKAAEDERRALEESKGPAIAMAKEQIKLAKEQASKLQADIGAAFQPGGKIQSRLARIGGERTINVDRQIPQKQLDQLMELNKVTIPNMQKELAAIVGVRF